MTPADAAGRPRPRALAGRLSSRARALPWREALAVLSGYALLVVVITWPLAADFDSSIAGGGVGGDQSGYVWDFWYSATHGLSLWGSTVQETISAPFGRVSASSVNTTLLTTVGPAWVVSTIFSPIVAYNVSVFTGLVLAAASMYLLVRWLGLGVAAAVWAGLAFMIFPYEQLRASGHVPLAHIWVFPLVLLAGLRWIERPGLRRSGWLVASVTLCWLTMPYYGTMGAVMAAVIVAVGAVMTLRRSGLRPAAAAVGWTAGWAVVLVALPLGILLGAAKGAVDTSLTRSIGDLELYGARITDYLVPSMHNAFFAGFTGTETWLGLGSPGGERTAFVGYGTMLLAVIGLVMCARRWGATPSRHRTAVIAAVPLVLVLVLFSLASPTRWFGMEISMPSSLVFDALPYLRVYARFAVTVMAVLLVVAAIGLAGLMRGRSITTKLSVVSVALIVSALELPVGSPVAPFLTSAPPVLVNGATADEVPTWAWLRDTDPGEIVYEQPGLPNELIERYYMYGQLVHGQSITNGSLVTGSIAWDFMAANGVVTWPGVPERLAALRIGLVTINPWAYAMAGLPAPDPASPPPGFTVVRRFGDGSAVWRVAARPDGAVAIPRLEGWWAPELIEGGVWRYMARRARVTVVAPTAGEYRVSFRARGWRGDRGERYGLTVRGRGEELTRATVGPEREVSFTVSLPAGRSELRVVSSRPARVIGGGDLRRVTMQMSDWTLSRVTPAG